MAAVIHSSHPVSFPTALIAAVGKMGSPANPIKSRNGKNGKDGRKPVLYSGTKDSDDHRDISERYAASTTHGRLYSSVTIETGSPGCKTSQRLTSLDLDLICTAGMARHWGTSLIRLKYAHDASEFRTCLAKFRELSDDDELTQFLAHDVLLGWLLDRRIRGRGEWAAKCQNLRRKINSEALEAASLMAYKLGLRYDKGNKT